MRESTNDQARRIPGVAVAGVTALVSGVSVFVNSYGVKDFTSPSVYTTAKNLVAAAVLCAVAFTASRAAGSATGAFTSVPATRTPRRSAAAWVALAYVGVIGGGLAFVLFFQGLSLSEPASAALWRDTLVLWVALFAGAVLREKVRWWNVLAIVLLVVGEVTVTGGVGHLAANHGELAVLGVERAVGGRDRHRQAPAARRVALDARDRAHGRGRPRPRRLPWRHRRPRIARAPRRGTGRVGPAHRSAPRRLRRHVDDGARARPRPGRHVGPGGRRGRHVAAAVARRTASPAPSSLGLVMIAVGAVLVGVATTRARRGRGRRARERARPVVARGQRTGPVRALRLPSQRVGLLRSGRPGGAAGGRVGQRPARRAPHKARQFEGAWPYLELSPGATASTIRWIVGWSRPTGRERALTRRSRWRRWRPPWRTDSRRAPASAVAPGGGGARRGSGPAQLPRLRRLPLVGPAAPGVRTPRWRSSTGAGSAGAGDRRRRVTT